MAPVLPIATLLVLPDRQPLGQRLMAALADLSPELAAALHQQAERLGQAVVFSGEPQEAHRIDSLLRAAGLSTSLNLRHAPVALPAAR
jgi:hypothetical protein